NYYSPSLNVFLITGNNTNQVFEYAFMESQKRSGVYISAHPTNGTGNGGSSKVLTWEDGTRVLTNEVITSQFNSVGGKTKLKVSVWRQKQRLRVYLNEEKVFDLPRAFAADKNYNTMFFELWGNMANETDRYLVNNIKLAVGAPDTRNKLITEGKFVTRGILF